MPTEGMLSRYFNQEKAGEAKIETQLGEFSLAGEASTSARTDANLSPATTGATPPWGSCAPE
jgi:hypothetical protein